MRVALRRFVANIVLVAGLVACAPAQTPERSGPEANQPELALGWRAAAEFDAPVPSGEAIQGSVPTSIEGETVLINFWGSWCAPCKEEMPLLQRLADETNVKVIGVSRDRYEKYASEFIAATGAEFPNVLDPDGEYMEQFSTVVPRQALPSSVLVENGTVIAGHVGPFKGWSDLTTDRPR